MMVECDRSVDSQKTGGESVLDADSPSTKSELVGEPSFLHAHRKVFTQQRVHFHHNMMIT